MKQIAFFAAVLSALVLALFSGCRGRGGADSPFVIEIGGSTSVVPAMELLAAAFQEFSPGVKININGTGSSDGIRNAGLLYQFGMTSRELTPFELGSGLNEQLLAVDGIAVVVHHSNPVASLSIEQIRDIYTGAITDWSEVSPATSGAIAVVSREDGSGTRGAFEELAGFPGRLRAGAIETPSTGAVRSNVSGNPNAIGYVSIASVDGSVKAVPVDGAEPTAANILAGSYRIARPFILIYNDLHPVSRQFLDWAITEGQTLIARSWVPINRGQQ
ncbi:MAG: phosphate ABC transporter substrate-binding protein [Treponema sp.]|nr:phosphate ABC transporter substrate-binding protein [Treponema sp.]